MAVKKINSLNAHQNPATNENEFDVENYLNVNWEKIIDVVDNNADELIELNDKSNTNIQSLQEEISELKEDVKANSIIVTTEEATSLQINDANGARAKLSVKGNYRQQTREGYNLLNVPNSYTVSNTNVYKNESVDIKAGLYTLRFDDVETDNEAVTSYVFLFRKDNADVLYQHITKEAKKATFTLTSDADTLRIYSADSHGESASTTTTYKNLMLYAGEDEKNYEEYGKMPSKEFPSDVETVGGDINILDNVAKTRTINGVTFTVNEDGSVTAKGTANPQAVLYLTSENNSATYKNIEKGKYTLNGCDDGNANTYFIQVALENANPSNGAKYFSNYSIPTTFEVEEENNRYYAMIIIKSGVTIDKTFYPKIEKGNKATSYSKYNQLGLQISVSDSTDKKIYLLDIQKEMLTGDYFDLERKKEVHTWNIQELTGNENWVSESGLEKTARFRTGTGKTSNNYTGKCTHFDFIGNYNLDEEHCYATSAGALYIFIDKTVASTPAEFKTFLTEQATAGTPVKVYWKSDTTTELDLTETQIEQLEQLNKMRTYKEQTNIVTVEDLALMQLEYSQDLKAYIDSKLSTN